MPEEPLFLDGGAFRLFGVLHPAAAEAEIGWVLCAPFAEEKKGAHRLLVDVARALSARGIPSLRFDYRGTGDSEGSFTDFTLSGALADINQAATFLRKRAGVRRLGFLGVRLGAALAAQAAQSPDLGASALALWEPITNGRRYLQMNLRQKRIREMMTTAEAQAADAAATSQPSPTPPLSHSPTLPEGYDFDGYWITPELNDELEALLFPKPAAGRAPQRVLGISVNAAGRVAHDLQALGTAYQEAGAAVEVLGVAAEPFWNLQDPVPVPELVRATVEWMAPDVS